MSPCWLCDVIMRGMIIARIFCPGMMAGGYMYQGYPATTQQQPPPHPYQGMVSDKQFGCAYMCFRIACLSP